MRSTLHLLTSSLLALCLSFSLSAQSVMGPINITMFADSMIAAAGGNFPVAFAPGQSVPVEGTYEEVSFAQVLEFSYQVFKADWSGTEYAFKDTLLDVSAGDVHDGVIDFDLAIPEDAWTTDNGIPVAAAIFQARVYYNPDVETFFNIFIEVNGASSVRGVEEISNLQVFPNPAGTGYLNINSDTAGDKLVRIYDSAGRLVLTTNTLGNEAIDITSLAQGMHTVLVHEEEKMGVSRVMVR